MTLTWKQFKELVDAELKKKGIDENSILQYVDVTYPKKEDFDAELIVVDTEGDQNEICIV